MSRLAGWLAEALRFLHAGLDENLRWRLARQDDIAELRKTRAIAEQELVARLRKQTQELAHELAVNRVRHGNQLAMVKIQCKQELRDYQEYLEALDKLKQSLRTSYANLPEAVAFTIHHHAKQLLNRMWETQDSSEKQRIEMRLLEFMTAVHEDSQASLLGEGKDALPRKALSMIDADLEPQARG